MFDLKETRLATERDGVPIAEKNYVLRPRSTRSRVHGELRLSITYVSDTLSNGAHHSDDEAEDGFEMVRQGEANRLALTASTATANSAGSSTSNSPLPPNWEEKMDGTGRQYYVNHSERRTQWARPSIDDATVITEAEQRENFANRWQLNEEHSDTDEMSVHSQLSGIDQAFSRAFNGPQTNGAIPSAPPASAAGDSPSQLPDGWEMQTAPNGRTFFINHRDRKTTWDDPRTGRPTPKPTPSEPKYKPHRQVDEIGPLPPGWEERVHTDGRIFFIDHSKTKRDDPMIQPPRHAHDAVGRPPPEQSAHRRPGRAIQPRLQTQIQVFHGESAQASWHLRGQLSQG